MTSDDFWALVDSSREAGEGGQEARLAEILAALPPEEVVSFDREYRAFKVRAYRWDLWAVAYIINGGCSDDGFEYFRDWLISRGRAFYEGVLAKPETAAKGVAVGDDAEFEGFGQVARSVYERATGGPLPVGDLSTPAGPAGNPWEEPDLERMYPKLWKRFMD